MKLETKDRHYDLAAIAIASLFLVIVIFFIPLGWLRIVLGLPFVLFFPGYALISALFPRSDSLKFFDLLGSKEEKKEETELPKKKGKKKKEPEPEPENPNSIDGLERVALSFGLSIAVVPLIGLLLNLTYGWGDGWGIRENTVLFSILGFILITSGVAVFRRMRLPEDERFNIRLNVEVPEDMSIIDKALVVGIVIMLVASVGLLGYIIIVPREGESFTEFYILGSTGKASNYPTDMEANQTYNMSIGIVNHENSKQEYTVVVRLVPAVDVLTNTTPHLYNRMLRPVNGFNPVGLSPYDVVYYNVTLDNEEKVHLNMSVLVDTPGDYRMEFVLYRTDEEPVSSSSLFDVEEGYRHLHLWVKVEQ